MSFSTAVRLTLKFNFAQLIRITGWSESYDLGYSALPSAINNTPAISAFIMDRLMCLGIGPYLYEAVLSGYVQPATPGARPPRRSTLDFPIPPIPPNGQAYNKGFTDVKLGDFADFVTTDLYISLQTDLSTIPVYRRNCWLACLPDSADQTNEGTVQGAVATAAVKKFIGDLNNTNATLGGKNNVCIRSINRDPATFKPVSAWNILANTYTVTAHGFAQNQPVNAVGMTTIPGGSCPRGTYLVGPPIDANTISLQGSSPPTAPHNLGGFRPSTVIYNNVTVAQPLGFTKRNHGRPFGALVGRRPKSRTKRA